MTIDTKIKQSKFENGYQRALINIIYTANWMRDVQQEVFLDLLNSSNTVLVQDLTSSALQVCILG